MRFTLDAAGAKILTMKLRDFLANWGLSRLSLNAGFVNAEFDPQDADRNAAWELYIELLTRVATQYLMPDHGDEKSALDSVHAIFGLTREILKQNGAGCGQFAKVAIPVLNQIIRPFTAKWHKLSLAGGFSDAMLCRKFRAELGELQPILRGYTSALAQMAGVEDLTGLEVPGWDQREPARDDN